MIKLEKSLLRCIVTLLALLTPSILLSIYSEYVYAASVALISISLVLMYNFKEKVSLAKTKILIALPVAILIIYITKTGSVSKELINISDILISIIIICLSLFIAGFGSILILLRTKGERIND
jgi:hypothetical protein